MSCIICESEELEPLMGSDGLRYGGPVRFITKDNSPAKDICARCCAFITHAKLKRALRPSGASIYIYRLDIETSARDTEEFLVNISNITYQLFA